MKPEKWYPPLLDSKESLRQLSAQAAERRVVLLGPHGEVERVLAEPAADKVHEEIRRLSTEHPGRTLCAEWMSPRGWVRWLMKEGKQ